MAWVTNATTGVATNTSTGATFQAAPPAYSPPASSSSGGGNAIQVAQPTITPIPTITSNLQPLGTANTSQQIANGAPVFNPAPVINNTQASTGVTSDSAINALYQKYFGRPAAAGEINYWKTQDAATLEKQLNQDYKNASGISYDGSPILQGSSLSQTQTADAAKQKAIVDYINGLKNPDGTPMDESQKAILRALASQSATSGNKIYQPAEIDKLLSDSAAAATADLTPYYDKMNTQEIQDLKNKMSDLRGQADQYASKDKVDYAATLDNTRKSLRASGLTFSGISRKTLGSEGALNSSGVEGTVPEARRLDYATALSPIEQAARDAGIAAERKLGSGAMSGLTGDLGQIADPYATGTTYNPNGTSNLYTPVGGTTIGQDALDKKAAIEQSKWSRIGTLNQYLQ